MIVAPVFVVGEASEADARASIAATPREAGLLTGGLIDVRLGPGLEIDTQDARRGA
jgi:hypothetical protein